MPYITRRRKPTRSEPVRWTFLQRQSHSVHHCPGRMECARLKSLKHGARTLNSSTAAWLPGSFLEILLHKATPERTETESSESPCSRQPIRRRRQVDLQHFSHSRSDFTTHYLLSNFQSRAARASLTLPGLQPFPVTRNKIIVNSLDHRHRKQEFRHH